MRSCYRSQKRICSIKGEDIPIVKNRKGEGAGICEKSVEKRVHSTIKITTNIISIFCAKERWEEEDGIRLQIFEQLDDQEQLSITTDFRSNK